MAYILIKLDVGIKTHQNIDPDDIALPKNAEIFEVEAEFNERLEELIETE